MGGGEEGRKWSAERGHVPPTAVEAAPQKPAEHPPCCPLYHEAIELIGRRWTGAIVSVLIRRTTLRFGEIAAVGARAVGPPAVRAHEGARGARRRRAHVRPGRPVRVEYELTEMGRELAPAVHELERWARRWLSQQEQRQQR